MQSDTGGALRPLHQPDLDHVLDTCEDVFRSLSKKTLFITGGTGFFGKWLLETWVAACRRFELQSCAWVLSRDPERTRRASPQLENLACLRFLKGDVRSFDMPAGVQPDYVLHAATPAHASADLQDPFEMRSIIVEGTQRVLQLTATKTLCKFLMVSSGAVYGRQPDDLSHVGELYHGSPEFLNPLSAYAEGKRQAEHLCALYGRQTELDFTIARCFAFVGPHLPLDSTFAIGNFIRDARQGGPVVIKGRGDTLRSYLYAADLTCWLWHLLVKGESKAAYNVGSSAAISIEALAHRVADFYGCKVEVAPEAAAGKFSCYVPDVHRAEKLGLRQHINLRDALARTERYLQPGGLT